MADLYEINCPHCDRPYRLTRQKLARYAGRSTACHACAGLFILPDPPPDDETDGAAGNTNNGAADRGAPDRAADPPGVVVGATADDAAPSSRPAAVASSTDSGAEPIGTDVAAVSPSPGDEDATATTAATPGPRPTLGETDDRPAPPAPEPADTAGSRADLDEGSAGATDDGAVDRADRADEEANAAKAEGPPRRAEESAVADVGNAAPEHAAAEDAAAGHDGAGAQRRRGGGKGKRSRTAKRRGRRVPSHAAGSGVDPAGEVDGVRSRAGGSAEPAPEPRAAPAVPPPEPTGVPEGRPTHSPLARVDAAGRGEPPRPRPSRFADAPAFVDAGSSGAGRAASDAGPGVGSGAIPSPFLGGSAAARRAAPTPPTPPTPSIPSAAVEVEAEVVPPTYPPPLRPTASPDRPAPDRTPPDQPAADRPTADAPAAPSPRPAPAPPPDRDAGPSDAGLTTDDGTASAHSPPAGAPTGEPAERSPASEPVPADGTVPSGGVDESAPAPPVPPRAGDESGPPSSSGSAELDWADLDAGDDLAGGPAPAAAGAADGESSGASGRWALPHRERVDLVRQGRPRRASSAEPRASERTPVAPASDAQPAIPLALDDAATDAVGAGNGETPQPDAERPKQAELAEQADQAGRAERPTGVGLGAADRAVGVADPAPAGVSLPAAALDDLAAIRWWVRLYGLIGLVLLATALVAATVAGLSAYGLLDLPAPPGYRWFWQRPAIAAASATPPAAPTLHPTARQIEPRPGKSGAA